MTEPDFARRAVVCETSEETAHRCAQFLADRIMKLAERTEPGSEAPTVTVAFSGGTTPRLLFTHLVNLVDDAAKRSEIWWSAVEFLQVDERIAPDGHRARNASDLVGLLLDPTGVAPARRHLIPVLSPNAVDSYEATVGRLAPDGIDIVLLGLGDDGHTASLVPGDPVVEECGAAVAKTGIYKGHERITITRRTIDEAGLAIWLVCGATKADALAKLMAFDETIPAGLVRTSSQIVFADAQAAALSQ